MPLDPQLEMPAGCLPTWQAAVSTVNKGEHTLQIKDAHGHAFRDLAGPNALPPRTVENLIAVRDYNHESWADIRAKTLPVAASAISGAVWFFHDPVAKQFKKATALNKNGAIDTTTPDCISVEYRNPDNMTYFKGYDCWQQGKWT